MKYVIIRLINSAGFVAGAIDWVTDSPYCDHAEIGVAKDPTDPHSEILSYIGAHAGDGVQDRPANYCTPTREQRYAVGVPDAQYDKIMAAFRSKIGTKYNYLDIFGLEFRDRHLNSPDRTICSQLVVWGCGEGDLWLLNLEPDLDYLATPRDIHISPVLRGRCVYKMAA